MKLYYPIACLPAINTGKVCAEQTFALYPGHKEEHLYNNSAVLFLPLCISVPCVTFTLEAYLLKYFVFPEINKT
jgi:hypothetical protein